MFAVVLLSVMCLPVCWRVACLLTVCCFGCGSCAVGVLLACCVFDVRVVFVACVLYVCCSFVVGV